MAVAASLGLARAVLHAPVEQFTQQAERDVAGLAADFVTASTRALNERGLSQKEVEMTAQALVSMLRLATKLSEEIRDVKPDELFDATKAYVLMQAVIDSADQTALEEGNKIPSRRSLRGIMHRLSASRKPQIDKALFGRAARYAFAAYGKLGTRFLDFIGRVETDREALDELAGSGDTIRKELIRVEWRSHVVGSLYRPGFYILVDHREKDVVLAIRGSFRLQDVVTDLVAEDAEFTADHGIDLETQDSMRKSDVEEDAEQESRKSQRKRQSTRKSRRGTVPLWESFHDGEDEDGSSELEGVFRNLSNALKDMRGNLNPRGDLESLQDSVEEWMTHVRRHSTAKREARENDDDHHHNPEQVKTESAAKENGTSTHRTHLGFLRAANNLADEVEEDLIRTLKYHEGYKLTVVGHSLGAAVAALLTIRWGPHPILGIARCVGIAPPCSVSQDFAESEFAKKRIHNLVLGDDVVPRLSMGSFVDLRDSIAYCARNGLTSLILEIFKDVHTEEKLVDLLRPYYEEIVEATHINFKLYPPGNMWYIPQMSETVDDAMLVPNTKFGTIILSSRMFVSHLPNYYAHTCIPEARDEFHHHEERISDVS